MLDSKIGNLGSLPSIAGGTQNYQDILRHCLSAGVRTGLQEGNTINKIIKKNFAVPRSATPQILFYNCRSLYLNLSPLNSSRKSQANGPRDNPSMMPSQSRLRKIADTGFGQSPRRGSLPYRLCICKEGSFWLSSLKRGSRRCCPRRESSGTTEAAGVSVSSTAPPPKHNNTFAGRRWGNDEKEEGKGEWVHCVLALEEKVRVFCTDIQESKHLERVPLPSSFRRKANCK